MNNFMGRLVLLIPIVCAALAAGGCGYFFKVMISASCAGIAGYLFWKGRRAALWLVITAFLFSIGGDWMLGHGAKYPFHFVCGVALFFVAHAGYLMFCLGNGKIHSGFLLVLVICYGPFFVLGLMPAMPDAVHLAAVGLYLVISCLSLATAFGLRLPALPGRLFFAGMACLVFSDTLIALHRFLHRSLLYRPLMLPAYHASQILVTAALMEWHGNLWRASGAK
jgi:hypothetical protein